MNRRPSFSAAVAVIGALVLAACGGSTHSGTERFAVNGIAVHFRYPSSFRSGSLSTEQQAGGTSAKRVSVGVDRADLLGVLTYPGLLLTVTPKNLAKVEPQINQVVTQGLGRSVTSTSETVHGIPVLSFAPFSTHVPGGTGTDHVYYAFVGRTAYELICQYTAAHIAVIRAACRQMVATLST